MKKLLFVTLLCLIGCASKGKNEDSDWEWTTHNNQQRFIEPRGIR